MKFPEQFRAIHPIPQYASSKGDPFGYFRIPPRVACGRDLVVMASDGEETEWEHVSVSICGEVNKCPSSWVFAFVETDRLAVSVTAVNLGRT